MKSKRKSLSVLLLIIIFLFNGIDVRPVFAQGGSSQVIFGGYYSLLDDTATEWNSLMGGYLWTPTEETWRAKIVSTDGYIKQLRVSLSGAPGAGKSYTFTLMLNGAPTALELEISDAETFDTDMIDEIDVTGGDWVSLQCNPDGTPTEVYATWSSVFESDTAGESLVMGGSGFALGGAATEYSQVMGGSNYGSSENNVREVIPTEGTLKDFYVRLQMDAGDSPEAYRFTVRLNGATVGESLIVTITADAITGNDLVHNLVVSAGDIVTVMVEPLNGPSVEPPAIWGMTFEADIPGESIVLAGTSNNLLSDSGTEYNSLSTGHDIQFWGATESEFYQLGQICTVKKLYVLLSGPPGTNNDRDFAIRIGGTNVVTLQISDAATTGNSGALEDTIDTDEYLSFRTIATEGGTLQIIDDAYWGFVCYIEPLAHTGTTSWTFHTTSSSTTTSTTEETITTIPTTTTTILSTTESTTTTCDTTESTSESCTTSAGVGDTETLYVDGYTSVLEEWDETGASPWLDNDQESGISTNTDDAWHDEFTFTDSGVGVGTVDSVFLWIEVNGPSARNDKVYIYLWGEAGAKKSLDWVLIDQLDSDDDAYTWYNYDVSSEAWDWSTIDGAKLKVQYQRSGSASTQTIYIRRSYLYVSYTEEPSTSTVVTTITTCTTTESTTESTTTSYITTTPTTTTTTLSETTDTPFYLWTVLQIVIDPCTTTTSTGACISITVTETTTDSTGTTCETETETECETICETSIVTHTTECETICETSTFTSISTECETETVTHTTECETVCETSTFTSEETTCETETETVVTECETVCETSTFTSESTKCETETVTHTTECETVCETSIVSSTSTACETETVTHTTECETICETSIVSSTSTACETETITHTTECVTECETSTFTSESTKCETETVTHTTECETSCETSTFTSESTKCETETVTHTTECETECETSTFTSEETTCETETVTVTTECETVCETSTFTSESTGCETETVTHTTECQTECETSTFTSEETSCETETVTHTTECETICETSIVSSTDTECETETITHTTECETICETSVFTSTFTEGGTTTITEIADCETVTTTLSTTFCITDYITSTSTTDVDTDTVTDYVTSTNTTFVDTTTINGTSTSTSITDTVTQFTTTIGGAVGGGGMAAGIVVIVIGFGLIAAFFLSKRFF